MSASKETLDAGPTYLEKKNKLMNQNFLGYRGVGLGKRELQLRKMVSFMTW